MYWKVREEIDEDGTKWIVYNFYSVYKFRNTIIVLRNPLTGTVKYTPNQDLIVEAAMAKSEEEFLSWYNNNKHL